MGSKFHKNAILTGHVDFYCLVCESHLRSEEDMNIHIAKPIHTKNLDSTTYLEKYKDDCVRKVKKGYYCEFCNILLSTSAKVGLHVEELQHNNNKGAQLLKRVGNSVMAFDDILINEKSWNGLIDDTCAICNTEFHNEHIHKTEPTHILNVVQNKVDFGTDKSVYRKIDESSFHCLTCNMVLALSTITTHFNQPEHKNLYMECRQNKLESDISNISEKHTHLDENQEQTPNITNANVKEPNSVQSIITEKIKVIDPVGGRRKLKNVFEFETTLAGTKKPESPMESIKISENPVEIASKYEKPTESAKKPEKPVECVKKPVNVSNIKKPEKPCANLEKVTSELDEEICKALGAKDYITHDDNGKKWCILCDWTMESAGIEAHVLGRHHQTMLKMHKDRLYEKQKANEAFKTKSETKETKNEKEETDAAEQANKTKILDSLIKFQSNDITINFVTQKAVCRKCLSVLHFNFESIDNHVEMHLKEQKKLAKKETSVKDQNKIAEETRKTVGNLVQMKRKDSDGDTRASSAASSREMDEEAEKFAKKNDLIYNPIGTKVYCRICDSQIPSSLKNMKEHISGISHKNKAAKVSELKPTKPVTVKKSMKDFIKSIVALENGFMKDVIINEKYCVNIFSFMMIVKQNQVWLKCEACEVALKINQVDMHKATLCHERAMSETLVVASMESEFIREVRPGVFHCGFCNIIQSDPDDLEVHLRSTSHRESKTSANWRLQQYMPEIMQNQQQRQMEMLLLMRMMMNGNVF